MLPRLAVCPFLRVRRRVNQAAALQCGPAIRLVLLGLCSLALVQAIRRVPRAPSSVLATRCLPKLVALSLCWLVLALALAVLWISQVAPPLLLPVAMFACLLVLPLRARVALLRSALLMLLLRVAVVAYSSALALPAPLLAL
jgi:hypothetical protein